MKKAAMVFVLLMLLLTPGAAKAESAKELTEDSDRFDGSQVSFGGEVIGVMVQGEHAWVNILDGGYAIGVWCDAEKAEDINYVGDYAHVGDYVVGTGVYNMACAEHGGDSDVHASLIRVSAPGRTVSREPNLLLTLVSAVFLAAAIFVSFYLWRIRKEKRKISPWPTY